MGFGRFVGSTPNPQHTGGLLPAVFLLTAGRLGDKFGRFRIFELGLSVFAISAFVAFLAPDPFWLYVGRALTGFGSAMIFATSTALLTASVLPEKRGRTLGLNVAAVYTGLSMGPVLGGVLTGWWGWRDLFLLQGTVAIVLILPILLRRHKEPRPQHAAGSDFPGTVLYSLATVGIVVGLSLLPSSLGWLVAGAGLCVGVLFLVWERKASRPLLDTRLFTRNRIFALSSFSALISYAATFASSFFVSLYLQVVQGFDPGTAGLVLLVQPGVQAVLSPTAGRISDRTGAALPASLGMALTCLGLAGLAVLNTESSYFWVVGSLAVLGAGFALFSAPNTNAIMGSVEKSHWGIASAIVATMRVLGQTLSMATALLLLAFFMGETPVSSRYASTYLDAQRVSFTVFSVLCLVGIPASVYRGKHRDTAEKT